MRHLQSNGAIGVRNFRGQQVAVLNSDVVRRALDVNVDPTVALEAVPFPERRIIGAIPSLSLGAGCLCHLAQPEREKERRCKGKSQHDQISKR